MKTKIMLVLPELCIGGAETLVKEYLLNFNTNKFSVILLCLKHNKDSVYEKFLEDKGIRVIYVEDFLWMKRGSGLVAKFFNHFQRYMVTRKIIKKESPDVLHGHLGVNSFIKFAMPKSGTVIFYTVHTEPKRLWGDARNMKREYGATKWLVKRYGMKFIVLHEEMRKEVERMFNVKDVIVLNNGIDVSKYRNLKDRYNIRTELGIPKDAFVVGHVGRFVDVKNHGFLVDVFRKIEKADKFLVMVGDGIEKDKIVHKLDEYGLTDDYVMLANRDDIPDLLGAMDIFVFPSLCEGLGIALVEAQEAGLPCFVSNVVPEHAIISNLVVRLPLDSPSDWAGAIERYQKPTKVLLNDENWDIKKITRDLEQIYLKSVLNNKEQIK